MDQENTVLCASNHYTKKYYFNPEFGILPEQVKEELKIMCVLFTEEAGGIFTVEFTPEGELRLKTEAGENDLLYDEISAGLKIRELQNSRRELFASLELFYQIFSGEGKGSEE